MRRLLISCAALLALAGCGNPSPQQPRVPPPVVSDTAPASVAGANSYVVKPGDTIYSIARELHVSVRSLIDANQLRAPFQVTPGQRLSLPGSGFYIVAKGENLSVIARKTGVPFATLARTNGLTAPYVLQPGQKLILPTGNGSSPTSAPIQTAASPPPAMVTAAPLPPPPPSPSGRPTVQTLPPPPSQAPAAPPSAVASAPLPATPPSVALPAPTASVPAPAVPTPAVPVPVPAPVAPPISNPTQTAALPPAPLPEPPKSGSGFIWPLKGDIIAEYGTTGHGQHNDGINIAAPRGTAVMAAESGVVAYAGNELRGFGNLLLIKHQGGWMTAYAHNDALLVKRGDVVKRGQKIAKVGDSGGVSQTQLHFEVRQGTRAVDPATVLGGASIPASAPIDPPDPG